MAQRNPLTQYRLRRLAIELREFTISDLVGAAGGATPDMVHNFLRELQQVNPEFIGKKSIQTQPEGPGRRPLLYQLSSDAIEFLIQKNLEIAKEFNLESRGNRPAAAPVKELKEEPVAAGVFVVGELLKCPANAGIVFKALQPEFTRLSQSDASVVTVRPGASTLVGMEIKTLPEPVRSAEELHEITKRILTPWQMRILVSKGSIKSAYTFSEMGRFGLNIHSVGGVLQIELRQLAARVPTIEELGLPPVVSDFSRARSGLILAAGIGGSGRSRTLAALLEHINQTRRGIVATIEEPMLYTFQQNLCLFEQRQVGIDAPDFGTALNDSLEEKVDVLLISDVDDPKTFATVLAAAERTLVLCRVTAPTSTIAIEKLVELSDPAEREKTRARIAENLIGTIGLNAVPRAEGGGFVYAAEVLRLDRSARDLILDQNKIHSLPEYLSARDPKTQTFEMALEKLLKQNLVDKEWATRRIAMSTEVATATRET